MTKPSRRVLYRVKVLTNVKLHPRGKQEFLRVRNTRLEDVWAWSGATWRLAAPGQVRYSPAEGSQLSSCPPPRERCLDVWLSLAKESAAFCTVCLPCSPSRKHCTLKQRFRFKVDSSMRWSILNIKGVRDQYFILDTTRYGVHNFFVVFSNPAYEEMH